MGKGNLLGFHLPENEIWDIRPLVPVGFGDEDNWMVLGVSFDACNADPDNFRCILFSLPSTDKDGSLLSYFCGTGVRNVLVGVDYLVEMLGQE